eukprot:comp20866_c0_seq1/m.43339 comp20866_c0_seq1/g.43339  ORF comp20866_c0_seq1/g.43339 comp20866_c0_seq1/m.43339 type:complete len:511 (+) comp20866_c0_seq1:226-1758(+)
MHCLMGENLAETRNRIVSGRRTAVLARARGHDCHGQQADDLGPQLRERVVEPGGAGAVVVDEGHEPSDGIGCGLAQRRLWVDERLCDKLEQRHHGCKGVLAAKLAAVCENEQDTVLERVLALALDHCEHGRDNVLDPREHAGSLGLDESADEFCNQDREIGLQQLFALEHFFFFLVKVLVLATLLDFVQTLGHLFEEHGDQLVERREEIVCECTGAHNKEAVAEGAQHCGEIVWVCLSGHCRDQLVDDEHPECAELGVPLVGAGRLGIAAFLDADEQEGQRLRRRGADVVLVVECEQGNHELCDLLDIGQESDPHGFGIGGDEAACVGLFLECCRWDHDALFAKLEREHLVVFLGGVLLGGIEDGKVDLLLGHLDHGRQGVRKERHKVCLDHRCDPGTCMHHVVDDAVALLALGVVESRDDAHHIEGIGEEDVLSDADADETKALHGLAAEDAVRRGGGMENDVLEPGHESCVVFGEGFLCADACDRGDCGDGFFLDGAMRRVEQLEESA